MASILNADNGVVSGTSGLKYSSDNSGVIELQTSGATTLTLNTSKNAVFANAANVTGVLNAGNTTVGTLAANATTITGNVSVTGTQFVNGTITFANSTSNTVTFAANGSVGIGTNTPGAGIKLDVQGGEIRAGRIDANSEGGQISLARSTDNATAWYADVYGNTSTPSFRLVDVSSAAVSLAINSSGAVALRGGVSASGVGITFPSSQSASSDPNTLDDYEEGTWTPIVTLDGNNTNLAGSYSNREAYYTKIGNVVHYTLDLTASGVSTSSSSFISVSGLPFTAKNASIYIVASMRDSGLLPSIGSGFIYKPWVQSNSTYIYFQFDSLTTAAYAGTPTNWDSSGRLTLQGWYYTS